MAHTPNTVFYNNHVRYQINSLGFRDREYREIKTPNTYRIFVASDSVGFATNVNVEESYPKILERKLNEHQLPYRVEVLNFSMPALSIKQKAHVAMLYAERYSSDLLVIDYVLNDVEFESRKETQVYPDCSIALLGNLPIPCGLESHLRRSALLFLVKETIEANLQAFNIEDKNEFYQRVKGDYYQRLYESKERLNYLDTVFNSLRDYTVRSGIPIVMPIFPLIHEYSKYKWEDINDLMIGLSKQHKLRPISLLSEFRRFNYNDMRVQRGDFTHPSVKGNTIAAETLARRLLDEHLKP